MYYKNDDVRVEEMAKPTPSAGEILVKMEASGICGSDVLEWYRLAKAPLVLGHEMTGDIVSVGAGVGDFKVGDTVFVSHHVPCDECSFCLGDKHTACSTLHTTNYDPGGFAEYIRVPALQVSKGTFLLEGLSYEEGTFIEPLGCVVRGQRLLNVGKEDSLLVIGSGMSGILHIQLAKSSGVKRIVAIDVHRYKLDMASKFGADSSVMASSVVDEKFDKVIVCAGALSATEQALKLVKSGGSVLFFAVPQPGVEVSLPLNEFWRNQVTLLTSYGAAPRDLVEAMALLRGKKVNVLDMVTHRVSLGEIGKGFALAASGTESLKVIVHP